MLNSITINLKFKNRQDCIDLLDMLLLYSEVNIMLDSISLKNILSQLGINLLQTLVENGRVKIYFKENVYGPAETETNEIFLNTYTSKSNSLETILYSYNRQFCKNSVSNLDFANKYCPYFHSYRHPVDFPNTLYDDLQQVKKLNRYFSIYNNAKIPNLLEQIPLEIEIVPSGNVFIGNELYTVNYHGDLKEFQKNYERVLGYPFLISDFLLQYGESKGDFLIASNFQSEVSNPINIDLFKEMSVDVVNRNKDSMYQLMSFNNYVLDGLYSVGEAYLNQLISEGALMEIYKYTESFRSHLRTLPDDKNIVGEYNELLAKDYEVKDKSNKIYRFIGSKVISKAVEYGLKAMVPPIAVDLAKDVYSLAHDAFDTFVFDKMARGWRPNGMLIDFQEKAKPKLES